MAKTKTKPDKDLYKRLRDSGLRKKTAKRVSEAIPSKGSKSPAAAHKVADKVSDAADTIRERAGGGSRKRSKGAKKGARTRKANEAKRRSSARKGAKSRK
jgi:hypothetical protein